MARRAAADVNCYRADDARGSERQPVVIAGYNARQASNTLTRSQAQAGEQQLAVFRVTVTREIVHNDRRDGA